MKRKIFAGISLTLFLMGTLLIAFPAKSQFDGTITIGAIGPMPWIQGQGIREGATLAAEYVNARGGVEVRYDASSGDWVPYTSPTTRKFKIEIVAADTLRGLPDPTTASGTAAALELAAAGVDFAFGGFRTEATFGIREVMMDNDILYTITGAATNQLVDDADTVSYPNTVRSNYARYKYLFRTTPMNSTMLFYGIAFFLRWAMLNKLWPLWAGAIPTATKLKVAVVSEALTWADVIHQYLTSEGFWNAPPAYGGLNMSGLTGNVYPAGGVDIVYEARVSPVATDVAAELTGVIASGARVVIPVLSGPVGRTFIKQWKSMGVNAFPMGIDVPGQEFPLHWEATAGAAEYEVLAAAGGRRTPITPRYVQFYDDYMARWGHAPIYTSVGAYDSVIGLWEQVDHRDLGALGYITEVGGYPLAGHGAWPMDMAQRAIYNEMTFRPNGMMRTFRFTGPHTMSQATYNATWSNSTATAGDINPTMIGTLHELYHGGAELIELWIPPYNTRIQWSQWVAADLKVVYPINLIYSAKIRIPPSLYRLAEPDLVVSGVIDSADLAVIGNAWQSVAADWFAGGWNPEADVDGNDIIDVRDLSAVAASFGETETLPLP